MPATSMVVPEPGNPPDTTFDGIFELVYKKGNILSYIHFRSKDKEEAMEKGRKYCEKKQLRYVYVNPWLFNLDEMAEHETNV